MKEILIFAGTTEGRILSERLCEKKIRHTLCVATEYGEIVLKEHPARMVHRGRMNQEEMRTYIQNGDYGAVIDATHPYADVVTANIRQAVEGLALPYLRLLRDTDLTENYEKIHHFADCSECAEALKKIEGNILLTTGSKDLSRFCEKENIKNRLYVRVLPSLESISLCMQNGIAGKQILALQGPFDTGLNEALIRQYDIRCLVTKESGRAGGYQEKIQAAKNTKIPVYVIGHKQETEGFSLEEVCRKLEDILKEKEENGSDQREKQAITDTPKMEIVLAGVGMGNPACLTKEVQEAIAEADILLGAERMISGYTPKREKRPLYTAEQILPYLQNLQETVFVSETGKVVILFSGDTGFYSGCTKLYRELEIRVKNGDLKADLKILPGISSVAYLAACAGVSYQDAAVYSIHGKELINLAGRIGNAAKTFLLLSGVKDINRLGKVLLEAGLDRCEIIAGYQLSYPEQKIKVLTPRACLSETEEGLYICLIKNPDVADRRLTHGMKDEEFIRDRVPMTKEEIREVSICKLRLHENAIVYDVGSGTGSVAVEIAGLSYHIQVYAIEQKEEAASLMEKNIEKFRLENITLIRAKAPEQFEKLPDPTHAFIGGSGGNMKEILSSLYRKNPRMRVVINAITMETICEIKDILSQFPVVEEEIVQLQTSRAQKAGSYHLMHAENPVWICAFRFDEGQPSERQ